MSSKRKAGEIACESRNVRPNIDISQSIIEPKIFSLLLEKKQQLLKEKESYQSVVDLIHDIVDELRDTSYFYKNENYTNISKLSVDRRFEVHRLPAPCSNNLYTAQVPYYYFPFDSSCPFSKAKGNDSFTDYLLTLVENFDLDVYQKCMDDYKFLERENPELWTGLLLRVFLFVMAVHPVRPGVIANFFHAVSNGDVAGLNIMVSIKPCFMEYILMNMAAVNRVEYSMVLDSDRWDFVKKRLIDVAFREKATENLRLLLLYFRLPEPSVWNKIEEESLKYIYHQRNRLEEVENFVFSRLGVYDFSTRPSHIEFSHLMDHELTRLMWRDSSRPYSSTKYVLEKLCIDAYYDLTEEEMSNSDTRDSIFINYIKVFTRPIYKPRSLMHLSTCKLRQSLFSALHIHFLSLPDKMKAYLNLEC